MRVPTQCMCIRYFLLTLPYFSPSSGTTAFTNNDFYWQDKLKYYGHLLILFDPELLGSLGHQGTHPQAGYYIFLRRKLMKSITYLGACLFSKYLPKSGLTFLCKITSKTGTLDPKISVCLACNLGSPCGVLIIQSPLPLHFQMDHVKEFTIDNELQVHLMYFNVNEWCKFESRSCLICAQFRISISCSFYCENKNTSIVKTTTAGQ